MQHPDYKGRAALLAAAAGLCLATTSCGSDGDGVGFETGPLMRPGDDCSRCHAEGSPYPSAPRWSLAGTVFPKPDSPANEGVAGVTVTVTDDAGALVTTLISNEVGNFYTAAPLPKPFRVALEYQGKRIEMPCPPPAGNCGACHSLPPIGGPLGRIAVPQGLTNLTGDFDCATWSRH
ncbi:MAG TPA: carboxypeptidase-like regulatory domain-containing protein [Polyangiaceae bacterium]|nr:carboxypeptidase-like regulatory domain-containing protein [Polyangiaceae bacterium]